MKSQSRKIRIISTLSFCVLSVVLLTLGFAINQWLAVETDWFESHQLDMESLVIGRLTKTQQDGIFSAGGLTGQERKEGIDNLWGFQYLVYYEGLPVENFVPYKSQPGGQAVFFGILDKATSFSNFENVRVFRLLTAMTTALALTIIILWFYGQFGLMAAVIVLITSLFSQWLVVFGSNLWWVLWAFYVPMIASLGLLYYEEKTGTYSHKVSAVVIFLAVFIKCLFNGYEYMTTTLIMMVVPYIYYTVYKKWPVGEFVKRTFIVSISALLGVGLSQLILIFQISAVEGSLDAGLNHIRDSLASRTHSFSKQNQPTGIYGESLRANVFYVIILYLGGEAVNLNTLFSTAPSELSDYLRLSYRQLIAFFLLATTAGIILYKYSRRISSEDKAKLIALISATWFSLLAPLSWFVIFKGHSYIHTHMNFITWHMPFALFGFALCGLVLKYLMLLLPRIGLSRQPNRSKINR